MDPQNQLSGLDPKLKEAYERVMGTTIPPTSTPAAPPPTPQEPPQEPAASTPTSQAESLPPANQPSEPASAQPPPIQELVQEPTPPPPVMSPQSPELASSPVQPTGFVANAPKKGKRGGLKLSPPIFIVIGIVLLVLYIFFWIRVFNLSLF